MPILPLVRDNIGNGSHMPQHLGALAPIVDGKRWVLLSPPGTAET